MKRTELNRRDFTRLSLAAFGGVVAGTTIGCGKKEEAPATADPGPAPEAGGEEAGGDEAGGETGTEMAMNKNACRGLNACKEQGMGKHDCAGQGSCSTVEAHTCGGKNTCKYLGGCQGKAGSNDCKGMGGCEVPLKPDSWKAARAAFEKRMEAADKNFGAAPEPAASNG